MATTRNENEIKADIERHQRDHSPNILARYERELAMYYSETNQITKAIEVRLSMIIRHWWYQDISTQAQLHLAELFCSVNLEIAFVIARGLFASIRKSDKERLRSIFERCAPLWYRPIADFRLWLISL